MAASVFTIEDAKNASIALVEDESKGLQAVHDLVVAYQANRRTGSANTKTRSEVRGSSKKPWRQKGTGRARAGSTKSPIWVGGGVVFGPKPRDYSKQVNKSTRRLAFSKVLTERIAEGSILVTDGIAVSEPKTKAWIGLVSDLVGEARSVLVIAQAFDETTYKAARNAAHILPITADEVNVEQLLGADKILIANDALQTLAGRTAK